MNNRQNWLAHPFSFLLGHLFVVAVLLLASVGSYAMDDVGDYRGEAEMHAFDIDEYDFKEWEEDKVKIPDYPKDAELIKFEGPASATDFKYYIDENTLSLDDDGVVRYLVVIKSKSGSANVFYEGIRCTTREFKTYAYGVNADEPYMYAKSEPQWERIERSYGTMGYRQGLHRFYFCGAADIPLDFDQIVHNLKYGAETTNY